MAEGGLKTTAYRVDRGNAVKPGHVESVRIERSENGGFSVSQTLRAKPSTSDSPMAYESPKTFVFESLPALVAHLETCFGGKK